MLQKPFTSGKYIEVLGFAPYLLELTKFYTRTILEYIKAVYNFQRLLGCIINAADQKRLHLSIVIGTIMLIISETR